jgi:hypothetical protein
MRSAAPRSKRFDGMDVAVAGGEIVELPNPADILTYAPSRARASRGVPKIAEPDVPQLRRFMSRGDASENNPVPPRFVVVHKNPAVVGDAIKAKR